MSTCPPMRVLPRDVAPILLNLPQRGMTFCVFLLGISKVQVVKVALLHKAPLDSWPAQCNNTQWSPTQMKMSASLQMKHFLTRKCSCRSC